MRKMTRDSLPHLVETAFSQIRAGRDTWLTRLGARWWGVSLGEGCRFFGRPILRRYPGSILRLGVGGVFRSAVWSNLAGLNRPCILATLTEHACLDIGDGCRLSGTVIGAAQSIRLGQRVMCGANVTISDTDWHPTDARLRCAGMAGNTAPVDIGDEVWLGMNVLVLKGVSIGPRTVVAANSVVTRSLPGGVIAGGVPARVLKDIVHAG